MGFLDNLNSYAPKLNAFADSLAPLAQQNVARENEELMREVFAINPNFGQQLYGTMDNQRRTNLAEENNRYEIEKERRKTEALQRLAEKVQTGQIDPKQAQLEYGTISGDFSGMFGVGARPPAALQEWEAFNQLSAEDQRRYLQMKRANQTFDRGGSQVVLDPTGGIVTEIEKTISPEARPEFKAEQTAAIKAEENKAAETAAASKKGREAGEVIDLTAQAEQYLNQASGSFIDTAASFGKRVIGTSDEQTQANAALKVISGKLVSNMPRMEGPQSDKDVQLYKDMAANIADPTIPANDKKVALEALRELNAKYANQNADNTGNNSGSGSGAGGGRRIIKWGDLP